MHRALLPVLLLLGAVAAGCIGGDDRSDPVDDTPEAPAPFHQVVVAAIDSPVNVYHEHFQTGGSLPDHVLEGFVNSLDGQPPVRVQLSGMGDFDASMDADEAVWDSLEAGTLYYFEGTNVVGINVGGSSDVLRPGSHGTGVAGSIVDANPDAIIVLVQGFSSDSEAWAASQGWIDFMSMSYGPPGSVPFAGGPVYGLTTSEATRLAWGNGMVPVGAADNTPAPAVHDETAGPPWVVGIAGDHPHAGCRNHVSALVPDFTANFTQRLPTHDSTDGYRSMSGTSFATPTTAGTMSLALLEVRKAWNHTGGIRDGALAVSPDGDRLTNSGLRDAFNRTAVYFDTQTDCLSPPSLPVNPVAPWAQQGWGHIGPETVAPTVEHVLGVREAGHKEEAARTFMEAAYAYRETIWSV